MDVDAHFAALLADLNERGAGDYLHPLGIRVGAGEVCLGVDLTGTRHLLVPMGKGDRIREEPGKALTWNQRPLTVGGKQTVFADLACTDAGLHKVFSGLVDDAIGRVQEEPEHALSSVEETLAEWRRLLAQSRPLSEERARGLYGELHVLEQLARIDAARAVEVWSGPEGAVQDFTSETGAVEVKTSMRDDCSVRISSLDQLDRTDLPFLVLSYVHVVEGSPHSDSLDRAIGRLLDLGVPRPPLLQKVVGYGHVYREGVNDRFRFSVQDERAFEVGDDFPGLRSDDIPACRARAVSGLSYDLSLVGAPGELATDQLRERMKELLGVA